MSRYTPRELDTLLRSPEGLRRLAAELPAEVDCLEFKEEIHLKSSQNSAELRADCGSLATAGVGFLVCGVVQTNDGMNRLASFKTLSVEAASKLKQSIEDTLGDHLEPPLTEREVWEVVLAPGEVVLVLRVGGRLGYPVCIAEKVRDDGSCVSAFYVREAGKKKPLTPGEAASRRQALDHGVQRRRGRWLHAALVVLLGVAVYEYATKAREIKRLEDDLERQRSDQLAREVESVTSTLCARGESMRSDGRANEAAVFFAHALAKADNAKVKAALAELNVVSVERVPIPGSPRTIFEGRRGFVDVLATSGRDRATWFRVDVSAPGRASVATIRELACLATNSVGCLGRSRRGSIVVLCDAELKDGPTSSPKPVEIVRRFDSETGALLDELTLPFDASPGADSFVLDGDEEHELVFVRSLRGAQTVRLIQVPDEGPCSINRVEHLRVVEGSSLPKSPVAWQGTTLVLGMDEGVAHVYDPFGVSRRIVTSPIVFPGGPSPVAAISVDGNWVHALCENGLVATISSETVTTAQTGLPTFEVSGLFDLGERLLVGGTVESVILRKSTRTRETRLAVGAGFRLAVRGRLAVIGAQQWIGFDNSIALLELRNVAQLGLSVGAVESFTGLTLVGGEVVSRRRDAPTGPVTLMPVAPVVPDALTILGSVESLAGKAEWEAALRAYWNLRDRWPESPSIRVAASILAREMDWRASALTKEGKRDEAQKLRDAIRALLVR